MSSQPQQTANISLWFQTLNENSQICKALGHSFSQALFEQEWRRLSMICLFVVKKSIFSFLNGLWWIPSSMEMLNLSAACQIPNICFIVPSLVSICYTICGFCPHPSSLPSRSRMNRAVSTRNFSFSDFNAFPTTLSACATSAWRACCIWSRSPNLSMRVYSYFGVQLKWMQMSYVIP